MISFIYSLSSVMKGFLISAAEDVNPDFHVLSPIADETVPFDDVRIRVTPTLIQIGERKRIVVSQIREFQWGLLKENRLGWFLCKLILILLIAGALFFGLLEMWIYFTFCMIGLMESLGTIRKWLYYVSIRTSGLFGEYIDFSHQNALNVCGKAIEAAIRARA